MKPVKEGIKMKTSIMVNYDGMGTEILDYENEELAIDCAKVRVCNMHKRGKSGSVRVMQEGYELKCFTPDDVHVASLSYFKDEVDGEYKIRLGVESLGVWVSKTVLIEDDLDDVYESLESLIISENKDTFENACVYFPHSVMVV